MAKPGVWKVADRGAYRVLVASATEALFSLP
jgi:hypothetical protein